MTLFSKKRLNGEIRRLRSYFRYKWLTFLLRLDDPKTSARRACSTNNYRFRAVYFYNLGYPATTCIPETFIKKYGAQMMIGGFGTSYSLTEFAYKTLVVEYAKKYNDEVLLHLTASDFNGASS